jgi:ribosomal protein S27E
VSSCTVCRRDAEAGLHACPRHTAELRAWLTELPAQAKLLQQFLVPDTAPAQGRLGGTGRATAPIPVDLRVLTLIAPGHADPRSPDDDGTVPILALLGAWAGHIAYTHPAVTRDAYGTAHVRPCEQAWPSHGETITGWCTWLTRYLPYALAHPWVGDLHRQLGDLIARIRDLTHDIPHRHYKAAPCPRCDTFDLVAIDGQTDITCQACGHQLGPDAYEQHAASYLQAHHTAA